VHLANYLGLLHRAQINLADAFRQVADAHQDEPDIYGDICWTLVGQAARGAPDHDLLDVVGHCENETATQLTWLRTRMKQAAPQALVVAD
jgi:hypothetical protein